MMWSLLVFEFAVLLGLIGLGFVLVAAVVLRKLRNGLDCLRKNVDKSWKGS
jgi:hypothetical protein